MQPNRAGSIRLFRFAGINVFMHWSWFVVAYFQVAYRSTMPNGYTSRTWVAAEYIGLFLIVLTHEFGHALACRSVRGRADQIVLWPLGGVAYVDPPPRPGAMLWSIAAGPLVNVMLMPVLFSLLLLGQALKWPEIHPNLDNLIGNLCFLDAGLFCFNMLPVYPLDGGQILQSLLWFWLGRARSLLVATVLGMIAAGTAIVLILVYKTNDTWLLVMAAFILLSAWRGFQIARALSVVEAAPRRTDLTCPRCLTSPPVGAHWACGRCRAPFDIFAARGVCPNCGTIFNVVRCQKCGENSPLYSYTEPRGRPGAGPVSGA